MAPALTGGAPGSGYGGAVFAVNGTLTATFVTFSGNTAEERRRRCPRWHRCLPRYRRRDDGGVQGNGTLDGTFTDDILGQSTAATSDFVADSFNGGAAPP